MLFIPIASFWSRDINSDNRVIGKHGRETLSEIARDSRHNDGWFRRFHLVGVDVARFGLPGLRRRLGLDPEVGIIQL